jgi:hypothetical protein
VSSLAKRFEAAVRLLVADGRLAAAYSQNLEGIEADEFPVNMRGLFGDLHSALHRVAPVGRGTVVKASVQKMSFAEAELHADTIVRLYAQLVSLGERAGPLKVVGSSEAEAPPRYLASNT